MMNARTEWMTFPRKADSANDSSTAETTSSQCWRGTFAAGLDRGKLAPGDHARRPPARLVIAGREGLDDVGGEALVVHPIEAQIVELLEVGQGTRNLATPQAPGL
jgi:hypothetical protein